MKPTALPAIAGCKFIWRARAFIFPLLRFISIWIRNWDCTLLWGEKLRDIKVVHLIRSLRICSSKILQQHKSIKNGRRISPIYFSVEVMFDIIVRSLTCMIAASLQAWPIGVWQATWQSERCVKHLAANERETKTRFFIAIRAARIHQKHSQISVRRRNWRKAWASLDARMIMPPWSAISTRWRMKKFIFTSITMRNLSIAPLSILPIPRTTMYVRILITVTVRHSKRGIRHKFIGHLCYKNAWPQHFDL